MGFKVEQISWLMAVTRSGSTDSEIGSTSSKSSEGEHAFEATISAVNDICQPSHEEGKHDSSHPTATNNIGFDFIRIPIGMRLSFNSMALQQYILLCTQEEAGFRDKPGKRRDHYHTCYVLGGLSLCQHGNVKNANSPLCRRI